MKLTKQEFINKTEEMAIRIGVELNKNQLIKLFEYKEMLVKWNENINLTAITDDEEIIVKHIVDSLETVKYIKEGQKIIDVGTGAGLPGIVIAIYFEGKVKITLFDALNKRILFLNEVIEKLGLINVEAVHGRAEETSREANYRQQYDIVISRAVAALNVLLEITTPFVKLNGICIYMKADKTEQELLDSKKASAELGVKYDNTVKYTLHLNNENIVHTIIIFKKQKNTNEKYPRQFAKIKKKPL